MNEKIEKKELGYYGFIISLISFRIAFSYVAFLAIHIYIKNVFNLIDMETDDFIKMFDGLSIFYHITILISAILGFVFTIISLGKVKDYTDYNKKLTIAGLIISSVIMLISILFLFIKY